MPRLRQVPRDEAPAEVLDVYRRLIALRRDRPDLTDGRRDRTSVEVDEERRLIVLRREATIVQVELGPPAKVTVLTRAGDEWVPALQAG